MSTIIRYNGHPEGYMDFYMGEEYILCENTVNSITAQQLWNAILEIEDDQLAIGFLGVADAEGKTAFINSALTVILLRNWRIDSEKTDNSELKVFDGNVINETFGTNIFIPNTNFIGTNQLSQFGVGGQFTESDKSRLNELWQLAGLDSANPMTVTPTSRVAGSIDLDITGDGVNTSTVTRQ